MRRTTSIPRISRLESTIRFFPCHQALMCGRGIRRGCARVPIQSKWCIDCAASLYRTRRAKRFRHLPDRLANSRPRNRPRYRALFGHANIFAARPDGLYVITRCKFITRLRTKAPTRKLRAEPPRLRRRNPAQTPSGFAATYVGATITQK